MKHLKSKLEFGYPFSMEGIEDMKKAQEWIEDLIEKAGLGSDRAGFWFHAYIKGKETETDSFEALKEVATGQDDILCENVWCFLRTQYNLPAHTRITLNQKDGSVKCRVVSESKELLGKIESLAELS